MEPTFRSGKINRAIRRKILAVVKSGNVERMNQLPYSAETIVEVTKDKPLKKMKKVRRKKNTIGFGE